MSLTVAEYNRTLDDIRGLPKSVRYHNSVPVTRIDNVDLNVWETLQAGLVTNSNILIAGERGDGKTLLTEDVRYLHFDGQATQLRMNDEFRLKDIYEAFDLEVLRGNQGTTTDARILTGVHRNLLTTVDETNRAHGKVQNRLFQVLDGYLTGISKEQIVYLGQKLTKEHNYHIVIGTCNFDEKRYVGISDMDDALLERYHLIINTDNYTPTPLDLVRISLQSNTKIGRGVAEDNKEKLMRITKNVLNLTPSLDGFIAQQALKNESQYCVKSPSKNKQPIRAAIPHICAGCHHLAQACGYQYPLPGRSFKGIGQLAKGLKAVADAKSGMRAVDHADTLVNYQHMLSAYELVVTYENVLDSDWVQKEHFSNPRLAIGNIKRAKQKSLENRADELTKTMRAALAGKIRRNDLESFKEHWSWYATILEGFNTIAVNHGDLTNMQQEDAAKFKQLAQQNPLLRWL